jgi:hypothetical protein
MRLFSAHWLTSNRIYGNPSAIEDYGERKLELQQEAQGSPDSGWAMHELDKVNKQIYAAKNPVDTWNDATIREFLALSALTKGNSTYTPHLLAYVCEKVWEELDVLGMVGGYVVYTIMTKLPGTRLNYKTYWEFPLEKREEVRAAFKEALL